MSIQYVIHYTSGDPTTGTVNYLSIDLGQHSTGHLYGMHNNKQIGWIAMIYSRDEESTHFSLTCTPPMNVTPAISHISVATDDAQGSEVSWGTSAGGTFDIVFSAPEFTAGSVTLEFNPGTKAPPLKLKVVVKREP
jgi:hypothetical protein